MTRSWSPLHEQNYASVVTWDSETMPEVRVTIRRMSLGRRIELGHAVRRLAAKLAFHAAGAGIEDRIEAGITSAEIDALYLRWGLEQVLGLAIDGETADAESIVAGAPEAFTREVVARIKRECGITEAERKN